MPGCVQVPLPELEARLEFFRLILRRPELVAAHAVSEADLARLARATQGCSGADMQHVAREAAMRPLREALASCSVQCGSRSDGGLPDPAPVLRKLTLDDFLEALLCVQPASSMLSPEE